MKKILILTFIFIFKTSFSQKDNFTRPNKFVGITPLKPIISSGIGLTYLSKKTENKYWGIKTIIYMDIKDALYQAANGIKIYGSYRHYYSEKKLSSFYNQLNLGGGYFSESVTYVAEFFNNEDYYPIDRQKQFLAIGGNLQLGHHLILKKISFDLNVGFQILKRILDSSIEYQGVRFYKNKAACESAWSDNGRWAAFGAGSILNASFTIKYNIY